MKSNIHIRFALYVLWVTAGCASLVLSWHSGFPWIVFVLWMPSASKLIGKERGYFFDFDSPVSDRALVLGFLAFLVVFWVGGLYFAIHFNPAHPPIRLMWAALAVMWLVFLYPGYRWWRAKRREVDA
jgi:hypothetical protein